MRDSVGYFSPQKVKRDDTWEKDTMFYTLIVSNNGTHKKNAIMIILSLVSKFLSFRDFVG
jgi:hypothetical protein